MLSPVSSISPCLAFIHVMAGNRDSSSALILVTTNLKENVQPPDSEVIGCEPVDMGARKQSQVLWKSSMSS